MGYSMYVNRTHRGCFIYQPSIASDIIALLIVGVIFVGLFLCWQYYLEKRFDDHNSTYSVFTPPPLMRISLWTRAHGRLGAVMLVAFTTWSCFQSWLYWIQVCSVYDRIVIDFMTTTALTDVLSKLPPIFCSADCRPSRANVLLRYCMQCVFCIDGSPCAPCLACWSVY